MKIALFDYSVTGSNAIGKCNLNLLASICQKHEFTVFSSEFENPCPERIGWVRVPTWKRPLALNYLTFHLSAPLYYGWHRLRHRGHFDLVQIVESDLTFGDLSYAHFCHRAFLKYHWRDTGAEGLADRVRWLNHWLHAWFEPWVYRVVKHIVVPSRGLARELESEYPFTKGKITILSNPIDLDRMRRPESFQRDEFRRSLGFSSDDLALTFVALGHYERKGLPLLLEALGQLRERCVRLLVVGGRESMIRPYRDRARRMGLEGNVQFLETQRDIRPYLWAADGFVLPSHYEVFPLVALEAGAAGVPILVTPVSGVEEFLRDGQNGILLQRTPEGILEGLRRFLAMTSDERLCMGQEAQKDVRQYGISEFAEGWSEVYSGARAWLQPEKIKPL